MSPVSKSTAGLSLLLVFTGVLVTQSVLSLQCYHCDSSSGDKKCHWNKNFTQLPVEECPSENPPWIGDMGCARVNVTMAEEDGTSEWYVFRGCMPKSSCQVLKFNNLIVTRNFTATECYVCDTDLCNTKRRLKLGQLMP